jgi:hypothetical protein
MIEPYYFVSNFLAAGPAVKVRVFVDDQGHNTQNRYGFGNEKWNLWGNVLTEYYYHKDGYAQEKQPKKFHYYSKELPEVGGKVFAIWSPLGLVNSVSDGIVSGIRILESVTLIQHTVDIYRGSSGGALLNEYGEVIGINSSGVECSNLEFAIPMQYVYEEIMNPILIQTNLIA